MHPFPDNPSLSLLPQGAVFLNATATLVVADLHLGKSAAFRARGLPVPEGDNALDLARVISLSRESAASHLVIAGDLFHAPSGITPELESTFRDFRDQIGVPITLVTGNHDAKVKSLSSLVTSVPQLDLEENCRVIHDPAYATGSKLHLAGHWHPVIRIPDGKHTALRLPCFLLRQNTLILPAFGSFTGGAIMKPTTNDRFFVTLRDQVIELPPTLIRSR